MSRRIALTFKTIQQFYDIQRNRIAAGAVRRGVQSPVRIPQKTILHPRHDDFRGHPYYPTGKKMKCRQGKGFRQIDKISTTKKGPGISPGPSLITGRYRCHVIWFPGSEPSPALSMSRYRTAWP